MQLVIEPTGAVRCIYAETLDLHVLGQPRIDAAQLGELVQRRVLVEDRDDSERAAAAPRNLHG